LEHQQIELDNFSNAKRDTFQKIAQFVDEVRTNMRQTKSDGLSIEDKRNTIEYWKDLYQSNYALGSQIQFEKLEALDDAKVANSFKKIIEDKYSLLEEKLAKVQEKLVFSEHNEYMFKTKYEALFEERKELYFKIKSLEDDFLKRAHTNQTIHLNKPKEFTFYYPKEGNGYH
jgi:chromosome segregation ATPase